MRRRVRTIRSSANCAKPLARMSVVRPHFGQLSGSRTESGFSEGKMSGAPDTTYCSATFRGTSAARLRCAPLRCAPGVLPSAGASPRCQAWCEGGARAPGTVLWGTGAPCYGRRPAPAPGTVLWAPCCGRRPAPARRGRAPCYGRQPAPAPGTVLWRRVKGDESRRGQGPGRGARRRKQRRAGEPSGPSRSTDRPMDRSGVAIEDQSS